MFDLYCSASFGVKQISNLFSDGGRGGFYFLLNRIQNGYFPSFSGISKAQVVFFDRVTAERQTPLLLLKSDLCSL